MSLIHEMLYQSDDLAHINFSAYLRELANTLFATYKPSGADIRLSDNIEVVSVGVDTAIQLGLIANELISNALKYAFPAGRRGEIMIELLVVDGELDFIVRDDGIGLAPDFDIESSDSLGLHLVQLLTRQIGGSLDIDCASGTEFRVRFPSGL